MPIYVVMEILILVANPNLNPNNGDFGQFCTDPSIDYCAVDPCVGVTINPPISGGDQAYCAAAGVPTLTVTVDPGLNARWYDAPSGGNELECCSTSYTPGGAGTYYVEAYDGNGCTSSRTAITVTLNPDPSYFNEVLSCEDENFYQVNFDTDATNITPDLGTLTGCCGNYTITNIPVNNNVNITLEGSNGCTITQSVEGRTTTDCDVCVGVTINPPISGGDQAYCAAAGVPTLTVTVDPGLNARWYDAPSGGNELECCSTSYTPGGAGTYYVEAYDGNGCTSSRTAITVTLNPDPSYFNEVLSCEDENFYQVNFDTDATNITPDLGTLTGCCGNYTITNIPVNNNVNITLEGSNGCTITQSVEGRTTTDCDVCVGVTINPPISGGDQAYCAAAGVPTLTVTVDPGLNARWYDAPSGGNELECCSTSYTPGGAGTYYVEAYDGNGCTSSRIAITVTLNPDPSYFNEVLSCEDENFYQVNFDTDATNITPDLGTLTGCCGNYTITNIPVNNNVNITLEGSNGCTITQSVEGQTTTDCDVCVGVTINPPISGGDQAYCAAAGVPTLTVTVDPGLNARWYDAPSGGNELECCSTSYTPGGAGTYYVEAYDGNGCTSSRIAITVTLNPDPSYFNEVLSCEDENFYQVNFDTDATNITPDLGTLTGCCGNYTITNIPVNNNVNITLEGSNGCTITQSVEGQTTTDCDVCVGVTINPPISGGDQAYCAAAGVPTLTVTVDPGLNARWYDAPSGGNELECCSTSYTPGGAGTYYVEAYDGNGCTSSRTAITVTLNPDPSYFNEVLSCEDENFYQVNFDTDATNITPDLGTLTGCCGNYTITNIPVNNNVNITLEGSNGCTITQSVEGQTTTDCDVCVGVTINPPISGGDQAYCAAAGVPTLTVTVDPGLNARWYDAPSGGNELECCSTSYTPGGAGTYYVEAYDGNGCTSSRIAITVTLNPDPSYFNEVLSCEDENFYQVNFDTDATNITPDLGTLTGCCGNYTITNIPVNNNVNITLEGSNGCTITQSVEGQTTTDCDVCVGVTINPPISGGDQAYCAAAGVPTLTVTVDPGLNARWYDAPSGGNELECCSTSYTPGGAGTYYVEAYDGNGCTSSRIAITVTLNPDPSYFNEVLSCEDENFYQVNFDTDATNITPDLGTLTGCCGNYTITNIPVNNNVNITLEGSNGCTITQSVEGRTTTDCDVCVGVTINPPISGGDQAYCAAAGVPTLTVTVDPGLNARWYDAPSGGNELECCSTSYTPGGAGTYYVEAYDGNGCTSSRTAITVTLNPDPSYFNEVLSCEDENFYQVNFDTDATNITPDLGTLTGCCGNYTITNIPVNNNVNITLEGSNGCTITQSVEGRTTTDCDVCVGVTINPPISGGDQAYCAAAGVPTLTVTVDPGLNARWYDAPSGGNELECCSTSYTPGGAGTYYVEAYDGNGCTSSRIAITLTLNPDPSYTFGSQDCSADNTTSEVTFSTDAQNVSSTAGNVVDLGGGNYRIENIPFNTPITISMVSVDNCFRSESILGYDGALCDPCIGVTVNAPTSNGDQQACDDDPIPTLSVNVAFDESASWYDTPTGGSPLECCNVNFTPSGPGTYYAEAYKTGSPSCRSTSRTAVTFAYYPDPSYTFGSQDCSADNTTSEVTFSTDAQNVSSTAGNVVDLGGGNYRIENIPFNTPITISMVSADNCFRSESILGYDGALCDPCIGVTVDAPTSNGDQQACDDDPIPTLSVNVAFDESASWYDTPTGGSPLECCNVNFTPSGPGTYYAEAYKTGSPSCRSTSRTAVTFAYYPDPSYTFGSQDCSADNTTSEVTFSTDAQNVSSTAGNVVDLGGGNYRIENIPFNTPITISMVSADNCFRSESILGYDGALCDPCIGVTVNAPTSNGDQQACDDDPIPTLSVNVAFDESASWYDTPTGGSPLECCNVNFTPSGPGTYYAEAYKTGSPSCRSTSRTAVTFAYYPDPSYTFGSQDCSADNTTSEVTFSTDAQNVSSTAGNVVDLGGGNYRIENIPFNTPITISMVSVDNCFRSESILGYDGALCDPCIGVTVNAPTSNGDQQACDDDPIPTLSVNVAFDESVSWYDTPTGGSPLECCNVNFTPSGPGTYYAEAYKTGSPSCRSTSRTAVTFAYYPDPSYTFGSQDCSADNTTSEVTFSTDAQNVSSTAGNVVDLGGGNYRIENIPFNTPITISMVSADNCFRSESILGYDGALCDPCIGVTVDAPTSNGDQSACDDDPIPTLSVNVAFDESVSWYDTPTGGSPLECCNVNFTPSGPGTYYAEAYKTGSPSCRSTSRTAVTFAYYPDPSYTFGSQDCSADNTTSEVTFSTDAQNVSSTAGNVVDLGGGNYRIENIPFNTPITISMVSADNCFRSESILGYDGALCDPCIGVTVNAPTSNGDQQACDDDPIPTLSVNVAFDESVSWYDTPTGGSPLECCNVNFTPSGPGTYYAEAYKTGSPSCVSGVRTPVTLTIHPLPSFVVSNPECEIEGSYAAAFTTDASNITPSVGNLLDLGGGNYRVENIPLGTNVSLLLVDAATNCEREETIIALNIADCDQCNGVTVEAPVNDGDVAICDGDPIPTLSVTPIGNTAIAWYNSPTGGNAIADNSATFTPSGPGTYYAEAYAIQNSNCRSDSRTAVQLTAIGDPSFNPGVPTCSADQLTYEVTFISDASSATVNIGTLTNLGNSEYQVSEVPFATNIEVTLVASLDGVDCGSIRSIAGINADACDPCTTNPVDPPISGGDQFNCPGESIPVLSVTVGANQRANWYDAPTGGTLLASNAVTYQPNGPGTYYAEAVSDLIGRCSSPTRTAVSYIQNDLPTFAVEALGCNDSETNYEITIQTDATNINPSIGVVTDLGNNTYQITQIPLGIDVTITLANASTGCSREETVAAIQPGNCTRCGALNVLAPTSLGDQGTCPGDPIPTLAVSVGDNLGVNWYTEAVDGNPIATNTTIFTPTSPGIYYAEAYSLIDEGCTSPTRTPVEFARIFTPSFVQNDAGCKSDRTSYEVYFNTDADIIEVNAGVWNSLGDNNYQVTDIPLGVDLVITLSNEALGNYLQHYAIRICL